MHRARRTPYLGSELVLELLDCGLQFTFELSPVQGFCWDCCSFALDDESDLLFAGPALELVGLLEEGVDEGIELLGDELDEGMDPEVLGGDAVCAIAPAASSRLIIPKEGVKRFIHVPFERE